MSSLDELLALQEQAISTINRVLPNLKKLGKPKWTIGIVKNRHFQLKETFAKCQDLDARINMIATDAHRATKTYFVSNLFLQCEDCFNDASDFMAELITHLEAPRPSNHAGTSANVASRSSSHLPQITLPKFDGALAAWESFRDQFHSLIHSDATLSTFEKMHFLKGSLTGDALRALSHLPVTEANYGIAWEILLSRYENKRRLITEHLHSLVNSPILKMENLEGLRDLRDTINTSLQALRNLNRPVDAWPDLVIYIIINKFDPTTFRAWETKLRDIKEYPTYAELDQFLDSRIQILEAVQSRKTTSDNNKSSDFSRSSRSNKSEEFLRSSRLKRVALHHASTRDSNHSKQVQKHLSIKAKCQLCGIDHALYHCSRFLGLPVTQRLETVERYRLCTNCLSSTHFVRTCPSTFRCRLCRLRHHTSLHSMNHDTDASTSSANKSEHQNATAVISTNIASPAATFPAHVLLATARVRVCAPSGRWAIVRALLDQGSTATLLSERLAQSLRVQRCRRHFRLVGVSGVEATARHTATISIAPTQDVKPTYVVDAVILSSLTHYTPEKIRCSKQWEHTRDLSFADPDPFSADPIDLIIGADLYSQVFKDGVRIGRNHEPMAQNTMFGWILSGIVESNGASSIVPSHNLIILDNLDAQLRQFWELEELPTASSLTPAEQQCENHFQATHSRTNSGRYIVRLPFSANALPDLGDSKSRAAASLSSLERRMSRSSTMKAAYKTFMCEYEELEHMKQLTNDPRPSTRSYYIPHHAVLRQNSTTSSLRVVFNASATTTNGKSLNDFLATGPKLQTDLSAIVLRWRQFEFALTADIAKMYRQILIHSDDADYQRILWRPSSTDPIREYQLQTVTYGTAAAPFLALRVLKQLASDDGVEFPLAVSVLQRQTYVDDCIFGAEDCESAITIRDQLISLLAKGGFRLRKWASNKSALVHDLDPDDHGLALSKTFQPEESLHILGLSWQPGRDTLQFNLHIPTDPGITKRTILSTISRCFDPLGWLTPVLITAKVFIQKLWAMQCGWDDEVSNPLRSEWIQFYAELPCLEQLAIPRWTGFKLSLEAYELHAFADASSTAFAAAVYARYIQFDGTISTTLLIAKSKVAPLKSISIPRLELCAAQLLARLVQYVSSVLTTPARAIHCWSDSSIVLAWLRRPPAHWKTFVANRISSIQKLTSTATWRHVPTSDNPADCASRGVSPTKIGCHPLWWSGPKWLRKPDTEWPKQELYSDTEVSMEARIITSHVSTAQQQWELQHRFSSWPKLLRVTALIFKFIRRIRKTAHCDDNFVDNNDLPSASRVYQRDFQNAKLYWLRAIQHDAFGNELEALKTRNKLHSSSSLAGLSPYIDSDGILRVSGRLRHANLDYSRKHPILLRSHALVKLLIRHHHLLTLHGGPQLTLNSLRSEYWILRARPTIRAVIHRCLQCVRERAAIPSELMGDLPSVRVNRAARAFTHTGVDYAGPIALRTTPGRGYKSHKAYIAVFICMTVKAIHLEVVSDYSSAAFIAAYHRFVSRRGLPTAMYSDNGTTFRGAHKELQAAHAQALRDNDVLNQLATNEVQWQFLPPAAPHFGGLWEAGVKSIKYHLRRCIGSQTLTYEEMNTLLCRIEACLNSRPIAPLSDTMDDYQALTPGHFLIGTSIIAPPESSLLHINEHRLSRWQLLQRTTESFWKAWSSDYMQLLQQRPKWRTSQRLAKIGRIVLLRKTGTPPSQWELGRITACHPGEDGLTRVVTVKTSTSEYLRPIVKLCFLPVDVHQEESSVSSTASSESITPAAATS